LGPLKSTKELSYFAQYLLPTFCCQKKVQKNCRRVLLTYPYLTLPKPSPRSGVVPSPNLPFKESPRSGVNIFNFPASSITGPALFLKKSEKQFFVLYFQKTGYNGYIF
jgi:hypothetical protein